MDVVEYMDVPGRRESLVGWHLVPEPEFTAADRPFRILIEARNVRATRTFRGPAQWRLDRTLYQPEVEVAVVLGHVPESFDDALSGATPGFLIRLATPQPGETGGDLARQVPVELDGVLVGHAALQRAESAPWDWTAYFAVLLPMDFLRLPAETVSVQLSGRRIQQPAALRLRWHGIDDYMAGRNDLLAREF